MTRKVNGHIWTLTDTEFEWLRDDEKYCVTEYGSRQWRLCEPFGQMRIVSYCSSMKEAMNEAM